MLLVSQLSDVGIGRGKSGGGCAVGKALIHTAMENGGARHQVRRRVTQPRREEQLVKQEATGANSIEPTEESTQSKQVEKQKDKMSINLLVQVRGIKD